MRAASRARAPSARSDATSSPTGAPLTGAPLTGAPLTAPQSVASMRQAKPEPAALQPPPSRPPELSRREYEVLTLLVRGCSNRQIANELCIDETTVKTHLHRIVEKLQVRDRTQAAILAVQRGWCPQAPVA